MKCFFGDHELVVSNDLRIDGTQSCLVCNRTVTGLAPKNLAPTACPLCYDSLQQTPGGALFCPNHVGAAGVPPFQDCPSNQQAVGTGSTTASCSSAQLLYLEGSEPNLPHPSQQAAEHWLKFLQKEKQMAEIDNSVIRSNDGMRDARDADLRHAQRLMDEAKLHRIEADKLEAMARLIEGEVNEMAVRVGPDA